MVTARRPLPSLWAIGLWLAVVISIGFLQFFYHHLGVLVDRGKQPFLNPLICEMTGAFTGGVLFVFVLWFARRFPLDRTRWPRFLPVYVVALAAFAAGSTTIMWGLREVLFPLAGLGDYDYGIMPLRYFMELPMEVIAFSVMIGAIHAIDAFRTAREREVHAAQLQSGLAQAQLRNLRLQLQPHFLFNALNTISSTMYRDPAAADEMLGQLSELLRASLRTAQTDEVPFQIELDVLDQYLAIQRARFGDNFRVTIQLDPDVSRALVPSMILQPLVENAVQHGAAARTGAGTIEIRASRLDARLVLEIEDDGPGMPSGRGTAGSGVGLSATAERLQILYGADHTFTAGNGATRGFLVRASFPFRTAAEMAP
ncbi:MAG: sensor histidine kinase [Acidobacteria bacterium]|nr:sensor histidine kinase [Acidobacteriota bacterium]